jgi:undecaprenyl-diphosphatase
MAAATAKEIYDTFKEHPASLQADNASMLAIGCIVAFIVSIISMRFFVNFVSKHGFRAFGVYRIIAGSVILYLALHQVI